MSGSPPNTPPYPQRVTHPLAGFGLEPQNPYPNFPPNTYHPPPLLSYPITTCDPDDHIPPPPGFIYQPPDPHSLTYTPQELSNPPADEVPEDTAGTKSAKPGNYRWVGASSSSCNMPGALLVGHDSDGSEIYAGRAYHQGDMIPAKVIPAKQVAYIAYGGEEIVKDQFELFCPPLVQWIPSSGGLVPENAVVAGTTADGENLYFGRVHSNGAITPGKVQVSHGCCYYPFDGQEMCATEYEVLVIQ